WRHHAPALLDPVLAGEALAVAEERGIEQNLVGGGALAALLGELHIEVDLLGLDRLVALGVDQETDSGRRVELDHELTRLRDARPAGETQPRRAPEHDPKLGLG